MDVVNALAAILVAVHHHAITFFIHAQLFGECGGGGSELAEQGSFTRGDIIQRAVVLLGNDEDMGGGLRKKIVESDDAIILEGNLAGNFMLRNLAENTVRHEGFSITKLRHYREGFVSFYEAGEILREGTASVCFFLGGLCG